MPELGRVVDLVDGFEDYLLLDLDVVFLFDGCEPQLDRGGDELETLDQNSLAVFEGLETT